MWPIWKMAEDRQNAPTAPSLDAKRKHPPVCPYDYPKASINAPHLSQIKTKDTMTHHIKNYCR